MTRPSLRALIGALLITCCMPLHAENIGMAKETKPNARSAELTKIFMTMLGDWKGTYIYFDEVQGDMSAATGRSRSAPRRCRTS